MRRRLAVDRHTGDRIVGALRERSGKPLLIDCHVHFHSCFEAEVFFEKAVQNLRAIATSLDVTPEVTGILLFAETAGVNRFAELKQTGKGSLADGWTVRVTEEACCLAVTRGERSLLVVAGSQIATRERIEVLALGTESRVPDGFPLFETLRRVLQSGALPVVPWGFGKWWLRRGALVQEAVTTGVFRGLFLGDIGGRPRLGWRPRLFHLAKKMQVPLLAGSDPLPFPDEMERVGTYGSLVYGQINMRRPAEGLKRLLRQEDAHLQTFGRRQSVGTFTVAQVRLRMKKLVKAASV